MVGCTYLYYVQTGQKFSGNENNMLQVGSFWAMALIILYAGRTYYVAVFRRALGLSSTQDIDGQSIWIFRVFLLSVVAFISVLCTYGVPLDLAVIWTLALLMMFLVICRLVAEMGIPWTPLANVGPLPFMLSVIGEKALGAKAYALLSIFGSITTPNKTATLLIAPAAANGAHVELKTSGRLDSVKVVAPFLVVFLVCAIATSIWLGYSNEGDTNDYPFGHAWPVMGAASGINSIYLQEEEAPGLNVLLAENEPVAERWRSARIDPKFPKFFMIGAALVLLTGAARLRFPRFPLHPLPLVLLGTWLMSRYWFSFLLGWLIKKVILKIGGGRLFERTRPFFVGVLTGLALIFAFWVIVNIIIYRQNDFTFDMKWWGFVRDMYSS